MTTLTRQEAKHPRSSSAARAEHGQIDADAFAEIYRHHWERMRRQAAKLVDSPEAAEDVAQEAALKAMTALSAGEEIKDLAAWLHTCVHYAALDWLKRQRLRRHLPLNDETAPKGPGSVADQVEARLRTHEVLRAVASLPEEQRSAFWLTEINGYEYASTAEKLGTTVDSVRQRLFRARAKLRTTLAKSRWLGAPAWIVARMRRIANPFLSADGEKLGNALAATATAVVLGTIATIGLIANRPPTGERPGGGHAAPLAAPHQPSPGADRGAWYDRADSGNTAGQAPSSSAKAPARDRSGQRGPSPGIQGSEPTAGAASGGERSSISTANGSPLQDLVGNASEGLPCLDCLLPGVGETLRRTVQAVARIVGLTSQWLGDTVESTLAGLGAASRRSTLKETLAGAAHDTGRAARPLGGKGPPAARLRVGGNPSGSPTGRSGGGRPRSGQHQPAPSPGSGPTAAPPDASPAQPTAPSPDLPQDAGAPAPPNDEQGDGGSSGSQGDGGDGGGGGGLGDLLDGLLGGH